MTDGERVGRVNHFFDRIGVAVADLEGDLRIGDMVHFLGPHTDFRQQVTSMQIEHEPVSEVKAGQEVAIKVDQRVRRGDSVFKLMPEA